MKPLTLLVVFLSISFNLALPQSLSWKIADEPWPESFGSQRAVLEITKPEKSIEVNFLWRRHDSNPEDRRFLLVEAATGDTIKYISRITVNTERCQFLFGPVLRPGIYYFYYLPFNSMEGWGYFGNDYLKPETRPDTGWLAETSSAKSSQARVLRIECRTSFDNFFPMEITPTRTEKIEFLLKFKSSVLYFTESRENPIRMKDEIPQKWILSGPSSQFSAEALPNEYFAFQVGVFAVSQEVDGLEVQTGRLTLNGKPDTPGIPLTCFNTQGVDPYGNSFSRKLTVQKGGVQALWIGADVPKSAEPGTYTGNLILTGTNIPEKTINVKLTVAGKILSDRGDSEPWRHSRLRWLNSTAGSDGNPVPPYLPIKSTGANQLIAAGHQIQLAPTGLPQSILPRGANLLAAPTDFIIETPDGIIPLEATVTSKNLSDGRFIQTATASTDKIKVSYSLIMDYDGYLKYTIKLKPSQTDQSVNIKDIRLSIPLMAEKARYMMGMGMPGCSVPPSHDSKWKGPSDSFWIGNTEGGIWCELRGSSYHGPLLNLYRPAPPASWNNEGKGGFRITRSKDQVNAEVYSGSRTLNPGDSLVFEWAMLITPVKELNPADQFTNRYYHHGGKPAPEKADFDAGVKIINVHHANEYNPYINYPFIAVKEMSTFVNSMHDQGRKVKIYYTVRELTNHVAEVWALRSLGYEILDKGQGGGYPWLREHFIDGYTPQWYQHFPDGRVDASILSAPGDSRWLNYYIEGLAWLVKNVNIDGLYLDDVTYDRRILQRMRRVMDQAKPGCLIDLHSNTGFSIGPANQYAEFFPYVDKLWFGESFQYDKMSAENWLVEVSGIPFGLMGDMLQGGGNRWLGMVFGMTVRYPWTTEGIPCDPRPVWKIWDEFGIQDAKMLGFWNPECPIKTDIPEIKATVYVKPEKVLISVGNFSDRAQDVNLKIDWKKLGINPERCRIHAPEILNFQQARNFSLKEPIRVEARRGWLIYIVGT